jgi:glycine reductase
MGQLKAVHFLNHFFAGLGGGEAKADVPVDVRKGPVGPGMPLEKLWKGEAKIVATVFCGDNYFQHHTQEVGARAIEVVREERADLLVAGPAFDAGRYGFACATLCADAAAATGVTAVTGMFPENPGVEAYRSRKPDRVYLVPTASTVTGMNEALSKMADLALRVASGEPLGSPEEEGYLPRGVRVPVETDKRAARRAVEMVLAKVKGLPYRTEVPLGSYPVVPPAPPLQRLAGSRLALVTTSGVVPKGNPDRFKTHVNTHWAKYPIEAVERLDPNDWEAIHGGYNTEFMNHNPHFGVPLDALRELEREDVFGSLHPYYYVVPGNQVQVSDAHRMAGEMAQELKESDVRGILLVAT